MRLLGCKVVGASLICIVTSIRLNKSHLKTLKPHNLKTLLHWHEYCEVLQASVAVGEVRDETYLNRLGCF